MLELFRRLWEAWQDCRHVKVLDALAAHAIREHEAGLTVSMEEYIRARAAAPREGTPDGA